ncbi:MAG: FtsW/RodA/SpoVE family cell cycle protein [Oscillospiraceae bacterium]|jgi:rod shape determining protein RodA|nr:FtsW/RodA/SpoVE family cell cycle protein [Oscillospiraceae bacterium]
MTGWSGSADRAGGSKLELRQTSANRIAKPHFDIQLLLITYALAIFGLIAITAAAYSPSQDTSTVTTLFARITQSRSGQKQGIFLLVSPIIIAAMLSIDYRFLSNTLFANLLFFAACGLLLLVGLAGSSTNNVRGWLSLLWDYTIQPAELAKIAVIIRLAQMLSRKENPIASFWDFIRLGFFIALPILLILYQGEMGSAIVFIFFFMAMILIAGVDSRVIWGIVFGGIAALVPIVLAMRQSGGYRFDRILGFFYPELASSDVVYQQNNSKVAVGSGGLFGQGMFQEGSLSALNFVPEDHTDFIFSSIGETMGFVGCMALLLLYLFLVLRMVVLAVNTQDKFGQLIIVGVLSMMMYHIFQGVGMSIGVMPVMGIPLPFVSYGGSNLTINMAGIGLVLNVTLRKPPLLTSLTAPVSQKPRVPRKGAPPPNRRERGRAIREG